MDVFKILSRATKPTGKSPLIGGQANNLPSAGSTTNPQLYHDPIPESRGQKRKHNHGSGDEKAFSVVDEDFNFFAPIPDNITSAKRQALDGNEDTDEEQHVNNHSETKQSNEVLDESECRTILRSHRLKVTMLSSRSTVKEPQGKRKKKSQKQPTQDEARKEGKEEPKRLYPQPLLNFGQLRRLYGISKRLQENLGSEGYKIPTEVQMASLPLLLRLDIALGFPIRDMDTIWSNEVINLMAIAPTGSGKTLAFLIPIVNMIAQRRRDSNSSESHRLEAIVVVPTRELASQIVNEGRKLALGTGIKVVKMQKGMKIMETGDGRDDISSELESSEEDQDEEDGIDVNSKHSKGISRQPMAKADILVTTPLALLHSISFPSSTKTTLPTVRHLVLDEADVLLDPLFREQTLGIWNACSNPNLQVTLWSATMGSNIEELASTSIHDRQSRLNLPKVGPIIRLVVGLKDSAIPNISHRLIYTATEPGKLLALRQLINSSSATSLRPPFLVFTQTIPRAIALHSEILYDIPASAGGSTRLAVLHSDLSSTSRSAIMSRFRSGDIWILITTDLLSRGVDFRGINGVVNYDIPNSAAAYIHRVGRTGRAGREGGMAVTFYTKEDIAFVKGIANIITASEKQAVKSSDIASTPGSGKIYKELGGILPKWLLDALPTPSKNSKKNLKLHGVEARRTGLAAMKRDRKGLGKKGGAKDVDQQRRGRVFSSMQISTKSGFERRLENRKRGAIQGSRRRKEIELEGVAEISEWNGFDE